MVEILVQSDQRTGATSLGSSRRARNWTLAVACMGVGLVVASMTALNTALGDLAVATSATQSQLTWVVDGYTVALACLLLPAGAIGDRYGRRGALLIGLLVSPSARSRRRCCTARCRSSWAEWWPGSAPPLSCLQRCRC
jgi:MFS family permease